MPGPGRLEVRVRGLLIIVRMPAEVHLSLVDRDILSADLIVADKFSIRVLTLNLRLVAVKLLAAAVARERERRRCGGAGRRRPVVPAGRAELQGIREVLRRAVALRMLDQCRKGDGVRIRILSGNGDRDALVRIGCRVRAQRSVGHLERLIVLIRNRRLGPRKVAVIIVKRLIVWSPNPADMLIGKDIEERRNLFSIIFLFGVGFIAEI